MPPYSPFSCSGSHIPQPTLTVEGWNLPSYGSNSSFTFLGESSQMGGHSTYYIPSIYPYFTMLFPTNAFTMVYFHLSSSFSSQGSQFYSMDNSLHKVPSSRGNIYPHLSNPCHVAFSSQATSSVMMPLQPYINQFGVGYFLVGLVHGLYHNPSWPAISQNLSFLEPWSQMSKPTAASPVTTSHTGIISPTSSSHIGDWSKILASHVEDQKLATASHARGTTLVTASHTAHTSPTSASHVGDSSPTSASHVGYLLLASASYAGSMSPATRSHARGIHTIEKPKHIRHKPKFLCRLCK
jgi:hypothetical protein